MIDKHTQHEALRKDLEREKKPEPPSTQFASFKLPKVREAAKPSIDHIPFGIPRREPMQSAEIEAQLSPFHSATDQGFLGESPEENLRAMSESEIVACDDIDFLAKREKYYREKSIVIETFLDYPGEDYTEEWFNRARGALIHFRICQNRIQNRIKKIFNERDKRARLKAAESRVPLEV